jgi:hypothetical protein
MNFKVSTRKNKKYMIEYNNKWIHFGDKNYKHFFDSTDIKRYSNLDHNDKVRQKSYLARAKGIKDKQGNYTYLDKNSPNYYAVRYLWGG